MSFQFHRSLSSIALLLAFSGLSRAEIAPLELISLQISTATDSSCAANGHYSVLRTPRLDCAVHAAEATSIPNKTPAWEPLDVDILQAEIFAFSVIGVAQIRGGTRLLSEIWYASALLVPPFMEKHPVDGIAPNYTAITPPFIALGFMNGYLHRDDAPEARIFLSNFIGFNLALLWSHTIFDMSRHKTPAAPPLRTQQINSYLFPLPDGDGAGLSISLQW